MKKLLCFALSIFACFGFCGCEVSNTELANNLEGNLTRLVYSVGYLDAISEEELTTLVNGGSTYFTHSSLYSGQPLTLATEETNPIETTNETDNLLSGGLDGVAMVNGRSRVYQTNLTAPISATSDDGNMAYNYSSGLVDLSLIENCNRELNDILLEISQKRGIIMLYCTDLRSGKATLSPEAKEAINEYIDILQETTAYLNGSAGDLTNHFNSLSSIALNENSLELVNARLIRANELLKTRYAKLDTCLDSMTAIIDILHASTSFNYIDLYNAGLSSYFNNGSQPNDNIVENENTTISLTDDEPSEGITNTLEEPVLEQTSPATPSSPIIETNPLPEAIPNNNATTPVPVPYNYDCANPYVNTCPQPNNCGNNAYSNAANNSNYNSLVQNTTPSTGQVQDNTVINYNYSGEFVSPINNNNGYNNLAPRTTEPCTNGCSENNNASFANNNSNSNIISPLPEINRTIAPSVNAQEASDANREEQTILNGGLVQSAASYFVLFENEEDAKKLNIVKPLNKTESSPESKNLPLIDLREEEITESEKELTPDLLPLLGEDNTIKDGKANNTTTTIIKELGIILPLTYEENNSLMLLPKK